MAQQRTIVLTDDLDGSPATETVEFALDGAFYEIELNTKNAKKLRDSLGKFVAGARHGESSTVRPARAGPPKKARPQDGPREHADHQSVGAQERVQCLRSRNCAQQGHHGLPGSLDQFRTADNRNYVN